MFQTIQSDCTNMSEVMFFDKCKQLTVLSCFVFLEINAFLRIIDRIYVQSTVRKRGITLIKRLKSCISIQCQFSGSVIFINQILTFSFRISTVFCSTIAFPFLEESMDIHDVYGNSNCVLLAFYSKLLFSGSG